MRSLAVLFAAGLSLVGAAPVISLAQEADQPRARGLALDLAVEASQASIAACRAKGFKVTVEVKDAVGTTVSILSDDGAATRSIASVRLKNLIVAKYKVPSGEIQERAKIEPALVAEIAQDNRIKVVADRGALPIMAGATFIGAYGVAGAATAEQDEACARAGLARIASRVR
jgi:uncharacterized protein GlcG (DUF336 family)